MRERHIANHGCSDERPVDRRKRHQPKINRNRGDVGNSRSDGDDGERGDKECWAGRTLKEGDLPCSDDMDDQRLSNDRLNEPSRVKESSSVSLIGNNIGPLRKPMEQLGGSLQPKIMAFKKEQHQRKGRVIENRTRRPDEHHELLNITDIPLAGLEKEFLIHSVIGNPDLGKIVEQVIHQDLD